MPVRRRKSYKRNARRRPAKRRRRKSYKRNSGLKPMLVKAAVGFLGFLGGRVLANQLATQPAIPAAVRPYAAVAGPAAMAALVYFGLGQKGPKALKKVRKYQLPLMIGAGVAALDALFTQFAPPQLQALVGGGAPALAGWQGRCLRSLLPRSSKPSLVVEPRRLPVGRAPRLSGVTRVLRATVECFPDNSTACKLA